MRLISPVDRWGQARDGKEKGKGGKLLSTAELQTGKNVTGSEWREKASPIFKFMVGVLLRLQCSGPQTKENRIVGRYKVTGRKVTEWDNA